jgi:hypothetical protein
MKGRSYCLSPPTFKDYDNFELIKESPRQVTKSAMKNYATQNFSSTIKKKERPIIKLTRRKNETSVITDIASFEGSVLIPHRPKSSQGKHKTQPHKINNITKGLYMVDKIKVDDQKREAVRGSLRRYLKLLKQSTDNSFNKTSKTQLVYTFQLSNRSKKDKKFSKTSIDEFRVLKQNRTKN